MTRIIVAPIKARHRWRLGRWVDRPWGPGALVACLLLTLVAGARASLPAARHDPPLPPRSWLAGATLLTVYGRGFGVAPVLGRLGLDRDFADAERQVAPYRRSVLAAGRRPRIGIQLIYALAAPCTAHQPTCLNYVDNEGVNLVAQYIEPAARRGWLVILDDQLGRSTPANEIRRLLAKGYLRFDNVEVAFDPEWRMAPNQITPGDPLGTVKAEELSRAEYLLSRLCLRWHLPHRKLLLVHQWTPLMIAGRARLRHTVPDVQLAVIMDGIGDPEEKLGAYRLLMSGAGFPRQAIPGIKVFLPSPYATPGGTDIPALSGGQILGWMPIRDAFGESHYLKPAPRIVVLG